jgi:glycosyltransferase involved in cell wall biosynthesis
MAMEAVDRDAILVIVGDGPERANLELLQTMATRPNSIRILGRVDDDELARWQRTAHVVVSLSLHESFGLSLAEGIAAGASIVASAIPAHLDLQAFSPVPFFLVDAEAGVREIGEALNAALAQPKSSDTSSRLPTWEEVAKRFEVLYTNAIESFGNN